MLHGAFTVSEEGCEWEDVVIPTVMGIWVHSVTRERAEKYFGVRWMDRDTYVLWLVGKPSAGYRSRVMELFLWYIESVHNL